MNMTYIDPFLHKVRSDELCEGWEVHHGGQWYEVVEIKKEDDCLSILLSSGDGIICDPETKWCLRPTKATLHYPDGKTEEMEL